MVIRTFYLLISTNDNLFIAVRCRVYLDVYDNTTSTPVVIFGSLVEEILGCTTVDLIDRTDEEHLPYIENIANNIENNEWIIVLGAQMNESGRLRQNKLTVLSVNNVPGTAE
ncbi:uncharacterized protein LOC122302701 [Carya illinoinensis]|uniref:uncharacterized protein LOC122302701 n=1 Tax=Carya illinoinensis TaxID=32201 RepID=UPI001C720333|nr:uncharacterized protein LOC122302701 [Carya illinoinensis]